MDRQPAGACLLRWRWAMIGLAIALLLWLPLEETHLVWILMFACLISLLVAVRVLLHVHPSFIRAIWLPPLTGLGAGLLITPLALLLMAFKSGLHGHGFPDFTPGQVSGLLRATPLWVLAGLLVGGGLALWRRQA